MPRPLPDGPFFVDEVALLVEKMSPVQQDFRKKAKVWAHEANRDKK